MGGVEIRREWLDDKVVARFWKKVHRHDNDNGCWEWTAAVAGGGSTIGIFSVPYLGKIVSARRVAYALEHGVAPAGSCVSVTCGFEACVRHLVLGDRPARGGVTATVVAAVRERKSEHYTTLADDFGLARDIVIGIIRNSTRFDPSYEPPPIKPNGLPMAKLTEADVLAARALRAGGEQVGDIADKFAVSENCMSEALSGTTWQNLPGAIRLPPRRGMRTSSKLTDEDVRAARALHASGESVTALGKRFGVTQSCMSRLLLGQSWKHVV